MGFAYYADGAHDDKDELEPGVAPYGTNSTCAKTLTCPAPMYFKNGTYLGKYSNIPEIANVTKGIENFGLDFYEPRFFHSLPDWIGYGAFEVKLRFDNEDFVGDLFYFCHVSLYYIFLILESRLFLSININSMTFSITFFLRFINSCLDVSSYSREVYQSK